MVKERNIWDKYEKIRCIGSGTYAEVYEGINKENGDYVAIKRINKYKLKNDNRYLSEIEMLKLLKCDNSISLIETYNTKYNYYIIMELCILNLEEYMKKRNKELSIEELKEFLIELNKILKRMNDNNIIHKDLKLSNILISIDKINKICVKLCDFGLCKNEELSLSSFENSFTISPEIMEEGNINIKNDIWSLGIIIYYLLFKEYPFQGKTEILLNKDIHSGKKLKQTDNNDLNDLINKMICINLNQRISWNDYFNHSFFKSNNNNNNYKINYPQFEFNCNIHNKIIRGYCSNCKTHICDECLNNHLNHNIIPLNKIGLNNDEILKTDQLIKDVELNIQNMNKIKENINSILNSMKKINQNNNIYNNDDYNNFKNYYIEFLQIIKEKSKIEENIKLIDFDELKYKKFNKSEIIEIEL